MIRRMVAAVTYIGLILALALLALMAGAVDREERDERR